MNMGSGGIIHRVRNIDQVNIRNLTPFPGRDTLTSTLASGPATITTAPADDIELTIARRRQRKTSESTQRSLDSLDDALLRPRLSARTVSSAALLPTVPDGGSSQRTLEKVIAARLFETFVTFSAPHTNPVSPVQTSAVARAASPSSSPPARRRGQSISSVTSVSRASSSAAVAKSTTAGSSTQTQTALKSPRNKTAFPMSPPPTPRNSIFVPSSSHSPLSLSSSRHAAEESPPFFKSAVHRPSTNPRFDVSSEPHAAGLASASESQVVIAVWGRTPPELDTTSYSFSRRASSAKGKEREISTHEKPAEWRLLFSYDLDLNHLQPLPVQYVAQPAKLPSNTLLLRLSPTGATYWLPPEPSPSRPASPDEAGSDGELDISTVRGRRHRRRSTPSRHDVPEPIPQPKTRNTATVHELQKLVHLQATLADTRQGLEKIVANCDALLAADSSQTAKREVSEREEHVRLLKEQRDAVKNTCSEKEAELNARRAALYERRATLESAKQILADEDTSFHSASSHLDGMRIEHAELLARTDACRADLLAHLSDVFPIAPLSAQHLLFAIVGVPLPVPAAPEQTGPVLTLHPSIIEELAQLNPPVQIEVNEDAVAAALGYVAQVLLLMSRYLGRRLIYIWTANVSVVPARRGREAVPYAVYLLNKNIELLMMDRDLHATDYNQTLPNLMNLLLTLTRPDAGQFHPRHRPRPPSPHLSVKDLHGNSTSTPRPGKAADSAGDSTAGTLGDLPSETASVATTATATPMPKERRSVFNFSPLAEMLRTRYPTVARNTPPPPPLSRSTSTSTAPAAVADAEVPLPVTNGVNEPSQDAILEVANGVLEANKDTLVEVEAPQKSDPPPSMSATPAIVAPKPSRMAGMFRYMGIGGSGTMDREEKIAPASDLPNGAASTPVPTAPGTAQT
ncbi:UV radiation resistance protein and autophagy-related subunit 14-domain-containing protein [Auriculariales sp. MPI-PUGE-AT-0066]|nr:UV radiation resistance protein and autophagy-related subunit 14-domain-containing protein [Auriculariales sp. MPI-PUGE-AT-0066]